MIRTDNMRPKQTAQDNNNKKKRKSYCTLHDVTLDKGLTLLKVWDVTVHHSPHEATCQTQSRLSSVPR